ncbi:endonuclease/exonuclease/phosphatase family protein [Nitratireductor luteus]|uniref:endonuclease/exonuclease/phosphatase family protein n=1 Tax=Nitratireductor luteus TaxID=2976980 RepID=UPI00223ECDE2|nr:endonuclease/exonuclease/phosphatase family protein [Nitratireductor luteus]
MPADTPRQTDAVATVRVLTYNVHSCRGVDRRVDPARIASVIAKADADIIALQEVDVGRQRSGGDDQARMIAHALEVQSYFHPALHLGEEKYGDAILTRLPLEVLKAGPLPSVGEPRGALLAKVRMGRKDLLVANTHLGLRRRERMRQIETLLGPDWLEQPEIRDLPTIFLGDFNAGPRSPLYRLVTRSFRDAQPVGQGRRRATFPARWPLFRIDHVFVRNGLVSRGTEVLTGSSPRMASDHLPVVATLELRDDRKKESAGAARIHKLGW